MPKNGNTAEKRAARARQEATDEPYAVALRAVRIELEASRTRPAPSVRDE